MYDMDKCVDYVDMKRCCDDPDLWAIGAIKIDGHVWILIDWDGVKESPRTDMQWFRTSEIYYKRPAIDAAIRFHERNIFEENMVDIGNAITPLANGAL